MATTTDTWRCPLRSSEDAALAPAEPIECPKRAADPVRPAQLLGLCLSLVLLPSPNTYSFVKRRLRIVDLPPIDSTISWKEPHGAG